MYYCIFMCYGQKTYRDEGADTKIWCLIVLGFSSLNAIVCMWLYSL
jgi:hypothetical protein